MLGDYNNLIVNVLDSISKLFTDLSCKASEVLDDYNAAISRKSRFQLAFYIVLGAVLMVVYGAAGIVVGVFRIVLSLFGVGKYEDNTIRKKELLCISAVSGMIFLTLFLLNKYDYAKNINLYYIECRNEINEMCRGDLPSVNTVYEGSCMYHFRNVLECSSTSDEVRDIRAKLDDSIPENLHFATVNDYLVTLLCLEKYDVLDQYMSLYSVNNNTKLFYGYLAQQCKKSFRFSRFYTSDICLNLMLKYSKYDSLTSSPHYNNSFYLMRLFNENIADRYFSSHHNNQLMAYIINDVAEIEAIYDDFIKFDLVSSHEEEVIKYLGLVNKFRSTDYMGSYPVDGFLSLNKETNSDIIKQYSLNMALRSQYSNTSSLLLTEGVSRNKINNSVSKLQALQERCFREINYPYLSSDLSQYTELYSPIY